MPYKTAEVEKLPLKTKILQGVLTYLRILGVLLYLLR